MWMIQVGLRRCGAREANLKTGNGRKERHCAVTSRKQHCEGQWHSGASPSPKQQTKPPKMKFAETLACNSVYPPSSHHDKRMAALQLSFVFSHVVLVMMIVLHHFMTSPCQADTRLYQLLSWNRNYGAKVTLFYLFVNKQTRELWFAFHFLMLLNSLYFTKEQAKDQDWEFKSSSCVWHLTHLKSLYS